jgi:hypothetical protein
MSALQILEIVGIGILSLSYNQMNFREDLLLCNFMFVSCS